MKERKCGDSDVAQIERLVIGNENEAAMLKDVLSGQL